jgi:hypothetical protein
MPNRKKNEQQQPSGISKDILDLLHQTFPDGVVEMTVPPDESYLADLYPKLRAKLRKVRGADLVYEREPDPEPEWADGDDPFEDLPLDSGLSASYHLFFLGLAGKEFTYVTETEAEEEDGRLRKVDGQGRVGCALAVCALAPLAVVRFTTVEYFEDGSSTLPDIWDDVFSLDGQPVDPKTHIQETFGSGAVRALMRLRDRLAKVLDSLGITLLSEAEALQLVPWLKAGEDAFVGSGLSKEPITVQEAFFFQRP